MNVFVLIMPVPNGRGHQVPRAKKQGMSTVSPQVSNFVNLESVAKEASLQLHSRNKQEPTGQGFQQQTEAQTATGKIMEATRKEMFLRGRGGGGTSQQPSHLPLK